MFSLTNNLVNLKLSRENTCPVESTSPVGPKEGEGWLHQLTFFSISGDIINRSKVELEPQAAHTSGHVRSLTQFHSMKQLGTLLLSPGWDASPSQGYPPAVCQVFTKRSPVPIYTPVWRETMWSKVSCLRKQHNGRDQGSNYRPSDREPDALTTKPPCLHYQQKPAVIEQKLRTSIYVTFQFWLG